MLPYMGLIESCVKRLYQSIMNCSVMKYLVELGIMEFNDNLHVMAEPIELYRQGDMGSWLRFHCEGQSLIGLAVQEVLSRLERRVQALRNVGITTTPRR